ncbi:MAG: ABC transporter permease [Phycisphaerae bacterium]
MLDRSPGFVADVDGSAAPTAVGKVQATDAGSGGASGIIVIERQSGWRAIDFRELWRYRELLYFLVWRDIKVRYKQTVVGAAWAVIQPVCTMVIFSIIFGRFAKIPSDGVPYPVFVYAGLLPWLFFANSVSQSSLSLVSQSHLLTKVYFPRLFIPATSIGVGLVDFTLSFGVYVGIMLWYGHLPGISLLLLPSLLLLTALTAFGAGVSLASVTVAYRDFRIAVPFMVHVWLYLSPVVYPVTLIPEQYRWIMVFNPMTGVIGGFRSVLLNQPIDWAALSASVFITLTILAVGVWNFRRTERRFADIA